MTDMDGVSHSPWCVSLVCVGASLPRGLLKIYLSPHHPPVRNTHTYTLFPHTHIHAHTRTHSHKYLAARSGLAAILCVLLGVGKSGDVDSGGRKLRFASVNVPRPSDGETPLMAAVAHGRVECVRILLATRDLNVNAVDDAEHSALVKAGRMLRIEKEENEEREAKEREEAGLRRQRKILDAIARARSGSGTELLRIGALPTVAAQVMPAAVRRFDTGGARANTHAVAL